MEQTTPAASETAPRATLDELAAEPGRVADQAEHRPVRIERTDGGAEGGGSSSPIADRTGR